MVVIYSRFALIVSILTSLSCFLIFNFNLNLFEFHVAYYLDVVAIFLFLILALRIVSRWLPMLSLRTQKGFNISRLGWMKSLTYESVLWIFKVIIIVFMILYFQVGRLFCLALFCYILEGLLYLLVGKNSFKLRVTDYAITLTNHSLIVVKWEDVKTITKRHNTIQFKLVNKGVKVIDLDLLKEDDKVAFEEKVKEMAFNKNCYFSN